MSGTLETGLSRREVLTAYTVLGALLILFGILAYFRLNPDAIAYLRIAEYYRRGEFSLALSGYWSPLLSWICLPVLALTNAPLLAARIALGISALVFFSGGLSLLNSFGFAPPFLRAGMWSLVLMSAVLSYYTITPDILAAGFISLTLATVIRVDWPHSKGLWVRAGIFLALASLAKFASLPITTFALIAIGFLHRYGKGDTLRGVLKACSGTLATSFLLLLPWITILSLHHGSFTVSTSARLSHAAKGPWPENIQGEVHPTFRKFHVPPAGRISSWEEPTMLEYRYWSPFESHTLFNHQLTMIFGNIKTQVSSWLLLGVLALLSVSVRRDREQIRYAALALLPVICNLVVYLPTHADDPRYYFPSYPFLLAGLLVSIQALAEKSLLKCEKCFAVIAGVFSLFLVHDSVLPLTQQIRGQLTGHAPPAPSLPVELSRRLRAREIGGPVIGGGPFGLYTAFFLDQPWYGDQAQFSLDEFRATGGRIVIVPRTKERAQALTALAQSSDFHDITQLLFPEREVPFTVFVRPMGSG